MSAALKLPESYTRWNLVDGRDQLELGVVIPLRTVSEANSRGHWAKKAKRTRQARTTVALVVSGALLGRKVTGPLNVVLTRYSPSNGLDDDNLVSSLKGARDGVADALGVNDRDPRIVWQYAQTRAPQRQWAVMVQIHPREATDQLRILRGKQTG
jgi:hypothetical protein